MKPAQLGSGGSGAGNTPFFGLGPGGGGPAEGTYNAPRSKSGITIPAVEGKSVCARHDQSCNPGGSASGSAAQNAPQYASLPGGARGSYGTSGGAGSASLDGGKGLGSFLSKDDMPPGFKMPGEGGPGDMGGVPPPQAPIIGPGGDGTGAGATMGTAGIISNRDATAGPVQMLRNDSTGKTPREQSMALVQSAQTKMDLRDWGAAINMLTKAIELDPQNDAAYTYRSMAYNLSGNYKAAEADAMMAIKLNPENAQAWENLAWAYMRQGKYQEALVSATQAIQRNPNSALAHAIRAYAKEMLGDHKGKMVDIAKAASLDSRFLAQYQAGLRGGRIYNPNLDYAPFFLKRGIPGSLAGSKLSLAMLLGALMLLLGLGAVAVVAYRLWGRQLFGDKVDKAMQAALSLIGFKPQPGGESSLLSRWRGIGRS